MRSFYCQKGNIFIYSILFGLLILSSLSAGYFYYQGQKKPAMELSTKKSSGNSLNASSSPQVSTNNARELISPMGQDVLANDDTSKKGPWDADLLIGVSNDGNSFRDIKVFEKRAGVPSVIHDKKGDLFAAFQWFPENNPMAFSKVAIKTSNDGGETWSEPVQATFANYPKNFSRPFDPTLVLTKEGKIRMYFTVNIYKGERQKPDPTSYYSAISDDGIHYTFEAGERFNVSGTQILDPAVVVVNGIYHLTAPKSPKSGAYYATSSDGLTFASGADIQSVDGYLWTGNLVEYGTGMRFYGGGKGELFYSYSADGKNWETPVIVSLKGGDPSVVQALESKYIIIYVGPPR